MATLSATPQLPPGQSPSANNYPRIQILPCRGTLHRAPLSFPSRNSRFPWPVPISETLRLSPQFSARELRFIGALPNEDKHPAIDFTCPSCDALFQPKSQGLNSVLVFLTVHTAKCLRQSKPTGRLTYLRCTTNRKHGESATSSLYPGLATHSPLSKSGILSDQRLNVMIGSAAPFSWEKSSKKQKFLSSLTASPHLPLMFENGTASYF